MSARVMAIIESEAPRVEIYSIDEAFADLTGVQDITGTCRRIQARILNEVGLPVCVGASTTKTLAKLANRAAKKYRATGGVVDLTDPARQKRLLALTDVADVWGVGPRLVKRLRSLNIHTALDLASGDPKALHEAFSVVLARTAQELNGVSCIDLESEAPVQQQIVCSRSLGERLEDKELVRQALVRFTANAAQRLRSQGLLAGQYTIFMRTSPFSGDPYYANSLSERLPWPTDDTGAMTERLDTLLGAIWRDGFRYAKAGVMLTDLYPQGSQQPDLFDGSRSSEAGQGREQLLALMDSLNRQSRGQLKFASEGLTTAKSDMRQERLSPRYTTRFDELPVARLA